MIGTVLITDFTGVYGEEGFPGALRSEGVPFRRIDLSALAETKCYCSEEAAASIRAALPDPAGQVHWIDSGDYHYMTLFFCERIREPFTLLLLDNHSDDHEPEFGGMLSCGGWVRTMKEENSFLRQVVTVGPDGAHPSLEGVQGPFYISFDKDILSRDFARTDWSQGDFCLEEVFSILDAAFARPDGILGIDICGELPLRSGGKTADLELNLRTNMLIVNKLNQLFR